MKHTALLLLFLNLPALCYAQLEVKNDSQIMWGFVEFVTRFLGYLAFIVCVISGFLFAYYSPRLKLKLFKSRKRRVHRKPRTATIKSRFFYKSIFLASLGASIFLFVLMFVASQNMR